MTEIAGFLLKRNGQTSFVLVMLFVTLMLNVTSLRYKWLTMDEPFHFEYGFKILLTDSDRFVDSKMPVSALNTLVVLGDLDADDPDMNLDAGNIQRARLNTTNLYAALSLTLVLYTF